MGSLGVLVWPGMLEGLCDYERGPAELERKREGGERVSEGCPLNSKNT